MSQLMLVAVGQAVIARDVAGTVVFWNAGAELAASHPQCQASGRSIKDLTVPETGPDNGAAIPVALPAHDSWLVVHRSLQEHDGTRLAAKTVDGGVYAELVGVTEPSRKLLGAQAPGAAADEQREQAPDCCREQSHRGFGFNAYGTITVAEGRNRSPAGRSKVGHVGTRIADLSREMPEAADAVRWALTGEASEIAVEVSVGSTCFATGRSTTPKETSSVSYRSAPMSLTRQKPSDKRPFARRAGKRWYPGRRTLPSLGTRVPVPSHSSALGQPGCSAGNPPSSAAG
jgi:PAS domain-containing protein